MTAEHFCIRKWVQYSTIINIIMFRVRGIRESIDVACV